MVTIKTLRELYDEILSDLQAAYTVTIPLFGKNFLRAVAAVQAGKMKLRYIMQGGLQKNMLITTADPLSMGGSLERLVNEEIGRYPLNAVEAQYSLQITGSVGATVPVASTWKADDDSRNPGALFILDAAYALLTTTDYITVRALVGGLVSQMDGADTLTATQPILNVDSSASVYGEIVTPQDAETIEEYRRKGVQSQRLLPQGGAPQDYRIWTENVTGLKQVYPYAYTGHSGELNLFIEGLVDGVAPSGTVITDVTTAVELKRPIGTWQINYASVVLKAIDVTITQITTLTAGQKTLITDALTAAVKTVRPYIPAADLLADRNDSLETTHTLGYSTNIPAVIAGAIPGVPFGAVTFDVAGSPETAYNFDLGEIPYIDTVTFI